MHTREEEDKITFTLFAIETMHICIYAHKLYKDTIDVHVFFEIYIFISIHRHAECHKSEALQKWLLQAIKTFKLPLTREMYIPPRLNTKVSPAHYNRTMYSS